jgi:hypothetical protein
VPFVESFKEIGFWKIPSVNLGFNEMSHLLVKTLQVQVKSNITDEKRIYLSSLKNIIASLLNKVSIANFFLSIKEQNTR